MDIDVQGKHNAALLARLHLSSVFARQPKAGFRLLTVTTAEAQLPIPSILIKGARDSEKQRKGVYSVCSHWREELLPSACLRIMRFKLKDQRQAQRSRSADSGFPSVFEPSVLQDSPVRCRKPVESLPGGQTLSLSSTGTSAFPFPA